MTAGKRANGEGSVAQRRDGRWMARINLPTGQRKTVYGATRGEAIRKLREVQHLVDDGVDVPTADVTLEKYLAGWLLAIEPTVRPGTFRRYEQLVRNQLIPELGRVRLSKLTAIRLQAFYALWLKRGLSTTSVRHLHTVLHRALKQAVRWGVATRNVAALVDPPKMRRLEFTVLSGEQARALLCAAAGERFEALYVLALSTGMRQGELLGLRWKHVDLDAGTLQVRATLLRGIDGLVVADTKTASSRRLVRLSEVAVAALRTHRAGQNAERLAVGAAWNDLDFVFSTEVGTPISASNLLNRSFHPLLERAGLPRVRFHDLRHTAATLLLEQGVHPKIVSEMLGHSTIAITLDLYSHVTPTMQEQAAAAMDAVLRGG